MWALFNFHGRAGRLGYWRGQLLAIAIAAVGWAGGLFAMLGVGPAGGILFVLLPPALVISLAACVRRLHDRGKGAWWAVLFLAGPLMLEGLAQFLAVRIAVVGPLEGLVVLLGALVLNVWGLIEIGFRRGQPDPNRFGDPPVS